MSDTIDDLISCCQGWEPSARLLGNLTAAEIVEAVTRLRADLAQRTEERDEARREICINEANELAYDLERKGVFGITGASMAEKRGWDCFKEEER